MSNLPYAVAVPVVTNLLLSELAVERMVVTVQWEIAERLLATPGTKEYAALAVLVQSLADVELVRRLSPKVFWPRPQVDSAIVCIRPSVAKRDYVGDPVRFRVFLRDLYVHRRKNLRGALASLPNRDLSKGKVDARLHELGIDGTLRRDARSRTALAPEPLVRRTPSTALTFSYTVSIFVNPLYTPKFRPVSQRLKFAPVKWIRICSYSDSFAD